MISAATISELDPFDLPDWVGTGPVTWSSEGGLDGHHVPGALTGDAARDQVLVFDLLAVDQAYPAPVVSRPVRTRVHQVWQHGQVLLLRHDGRATVATPGTAYAPDLVLETLARVARSVGADRRLWSVRLSLAAR